MSLNYCRISQRKWNIYRSLGKAYINSTTISTLSSLIFLQQLNSRLSDDTPLFLCFLSFNMQSCSHCHLFRCLLSLDFVIKCVGCSFQFYYLTYGKVRDNLYVVPFYPLFSCTSSKIFFFNLMIFKPRFQIKIIICFNHAVVLGTSVSVAGHANLNPK